jgi:tellurite methyltransferase
MFFPKGRALELLADAQAHVSQNGIAVVNVMVEGTTYMGMFEPGRYYLFGRTELQERFRNWEILELRHHAFEAPGNTVKNFATVIARQKIGR